MRALVVLAALVAPTVARAQSDPRARALAGVCRADGRLLPAAEATLDGDGVDVARRRTAEAGLAAASVSVAVFDAGSAPDAIERWVVASRDPRFTPRCAMLTGSDGRVALALAPRAVELVEVDGRRVAAMPAGVSDARLVVRDEDDVVRERAVTDGDVTGCDAPRDCQVAARVGEDVVVLARWGAVAGEREGGGPESEREVLVEVNRARRAAGLSALRPDPMLARVARERAAELSAAGRVAHALGPGDAPWERVTRAGLRVEALGENVARARSLGEAHQRLMRSPSHRGTLMHPGLDAVGVGVARGDGGVYVVEVFAARPSMRGP